ncbi:MAG TPA: tetratricopeptide repeat protein [Stellaceae bacterium]|nr:tetratricopeptide repeat protein [Stellaceae bacterium]
MRLGGGAGMRPWCVAALAVALLGAGGAVAAPAPGASNLPLLTTPEFPSPGPPHSAAADATTYERCMNLARDDPAAAKKLAEDWHRRGGFHPAEHCYAVALIGLGDYREAAGRLEALAEAMTHAPAGLRAGVLDQAAQAWLLAGDTGRAYDDDSAALRLNPGDAALLVDRAEAAGAAHRYDKAIADLDRVLNADPRRLDALIYRATAYRELGKLAPALADIDAALKLAPESVPALLERGNILGIQGDVEGARRAWERVAALAPATAAAAAAKANLARLNLLGPAIPTAPPPRR